MRYYGLFILLLFLPVVTLAQDESFTCPGRVQTRLTVGDIGRVTTGQGLNTRNQPDIDIAANGTLDFNEQFIVIAGPECIDGFTWWQVFSTNDIWIVETVGGGYVVEPTDAREPVVGQTPFITFTTRGEGNLIQIHRIDLEGNRQSETVTCNQLCTDVVWAENGRRYSIGEDLSVSTFDAQTGGQLWGLRSGTTEGRREAYGSGDWTANLDWAVTPFISRGDDANDVETALQFWNLNRPASTLRIPSDHDLLSSPVLSPDLLRVAYIGVDAEQADIYFYDMVNRTAFPVTNDVEREANLSWSPDGNRLAYNTEDTDGTHAVQVLTISNQNQVVLQENTFDKSVPLWSPAGGQLAIIEDGKLLVFNGATQLTLAENVVNLSIPAWSPDGTQVAYLGLDDNGDAALFIIDVRQDALPQQIGDPIESLAGIDLVSPPQWLPR